MLTDRELRRGVREQLVEAKVNYGDQAVMHLFKRLIPKSWSQAQIYNCLVEYGLDESRYVISTGLRRGQVVDFFAVYPEDWMKITSCKERPRHDLKILYQKGYIKELGTARLMLGHRKCTTIRISWMPLLFDIRQKAKSLKDYQSWNRPGADTPVEDYDSEFSFEPQDVISN
ncbi:hypothetical protein [Cerasicoccus frondis]|uniref:hypothetical protein n=1 Tax=Cerasicoccus frondis TaxID=490090 RepID=UPI002852AA31|nr:hypothetical protein [Cerasicoccus frondis]